MFISSYILCVFCFVSNFSQTCFKQAHGFAVCDYKHKCSNSIVLVYYVFIFLIQMNKSISMFAYFSGFGV